MLFHQRSRASSSQGLFFIQRGPYPSTQVALPLPRFVSSIGCLQQDDFVPLEPVEAPGAVASPCGLDEGGRSVSPPQAFSPVVLENEACNPHLLELAPGDVAAPVGLEDNGCLAKEGRIVQGLLHFSLLSPLVTAPVPLQRVGERERQHFAVLNIGSDSFPESD